MQQAPAPAIVQVESVELAEAPQEPKTPKPDPPPTLRLGERPLSVPRQAKDLTPEWLTKALRFRKMLPDSVSVTAVEHKAIGDGVMGDISAVSITYSGETTAPAKLVAKFSPIGKAPLPGFVVRAVFKAEAHFYNDFTVADGGLPRPECYLALYHPYRWRASFCMLLEDLMPASMFSRVVGTTCTDKAALLSFAGGIARLHARWWEHPKATPLDWALHPSADLGGLVLRGFMMSAKNGLVRAATGVGRSARVEPAAAAHGPACRAAWRAGVPLARRRLLGAARSVGAASS